MNETLFLPAGDSAVNVEFGRTIDPEINKKIRGLSDSLSRKPIRGVTECIPTFRSLLVLLRPVGSLRFEKVDLQYAVKRIKQDNKLLKKLQYKILRADTSISGS